MMKRIGVGAFSYLVPTFALGFVWHLVAFNGYYDALAMYRHDVIIPFGFLAMALQAVLFTWVFDSSMSRDDVSVGRRGVQFALFGAVLSWSFTTLAVAAKNLMTSVPSYLLIESAFHGRAVGDRGSVDGTAPIKDPCAAATGTPC